MSINLASAYHHALSKTNTLFRSGNPQASCAQRIPGNRDSVAGFGSVIALPTNGYRTADVRSYYVLPNIPCLCAALVVFASAAPCQQSLIPGDRIQPGTPATSDNSAMQPETKRIFWIIPNYRTSPSIDDFKPLTAREKFRIASQDAFDPGTFALAGLFAAEGQLTNADRSFGQGAAGYGRYFGTAFGDFAIGDFMTEGVFPTVFHQDPRYFRRGTGTGWSRLRYAVGQILWTHGDSGQTEFNFSELLGNSTAVAISDAYYPDHRTASDAVSSLSVQLGVDAAANVLKEFWPDFERKLSRKHHGPRESLQ
jgi:hypothetical protein